MAALRETRVAVNGVASVVVEAGPATATEAVVFVHGNPGSSWEFRSLLEQAGSFTRAIAVDMPGFGRADKPKKLPYTVDGLAGHLGGLVDALKVDRVHLVLHDFGGPWGLRWADEHRERLASMVLADTGVLTGYRGHYMWWFWAGFPGLAELSMRYLPEPLFRAALRHGNRRRPLPAEFVDVMYRDLDPGTARAILKLYRATARQFAVRPTFAQPRGGRFEVPGLVLWGARDPYVPVRYAAAERVWFRDADLHVFPDSGHWPHMDDPDGFASVLLPFLRRVTATVSLPT